MPNKRLNKKQRIENAKAFPPLAATSPSYVRALTRKWWYTGTLSIDFSSTGFEQLINLIPQGVTQNARLGQRVEMVELNLLGKLVQASITTGAPITMMVVYDNCPGTGGSPPPIGNLIADAYGTANALQHAQCMQNKCYEKRFKILWQQRWNPPKGLTYWRDEINSTAMIDAKIPLDGLPVVWDYGGVTPTTGNDYHNGALWIVGFGLVAADVSLTATVAATLEYRDRE